MLNPPRPDFARPGAGIGNDYSFTHFGRPPSDAVQYGLEQQPVCSENPNSGRTEREAEFRINPHAGAKPGFTTACPSARPRSPSGSASSSFALERVEIGLLALAARDAFGIAATPS